jgi:tripartite-type tricarboxylate transporter receptor subunit TctC
MTGTRRRVIKTIALPFALQLGLAGAALAQGSYPSEPVRIVVGASAGGGTDILARMLAARFEQDMKQSFVVENRPGASNTIAAELTARAKPDGHTLLVATNTGQAIAPHLLKLKYDPLKDLQPIGLVAIMPNVLVVSVDSPYKSVKDLIEAMKAKPGTFKYASSGIGSTQHIAGEAFKLATGVQATHIPYKGSSQAHVDIIGGQVEMMLDSISSAMSQIKAGKFRPLAVANDKRLAELPNVPTLAEEGVKDAEVATWYGLLTTNGVPAEVVKRLSEALAKAHEHPDVKARIAGLGGSTEPMTVEQFSQFNQREYERYGALVKAANIKPE